MSALMKPMAASDRMVWFDANRSLAAFGVVLIHCTTDFAGSADRP
jgi:surface polysaccharide O-acyltransferase-like enzyme